jgi:catechol 2,3-dioxygenase
MTDTIARLKPLSDPVTARPIADGVRIGHVHLKVADLDRALSFYCGILGFELLQRRGREAAFISAGGYQPADRGRHSPRRRERSWRERGALPARFR